MPLSRKPEPPKDPDLLPEEPPPEEGEHKRCPYCAEQILRVAKKCKWCGEDVDARSRVAKARAGKRGRGGDASEVGPDVMDYILCFLCPGIACILGVVALLRGQSKRGGIMVAVSLVWGLILGGIQATTGPSHSHPDYR